MKEGYSKNRIIGIDPGTNILGYAIIDAEKNQYHLHEMGTLRMTHLDNQADKLRIIFNRLLQLILQYKPTTLAIEAPFYGKNVQSMLKLGRAQGVVMAAALSQGLEIGEYSPRKVKQSITGNGNAAKEQVAAVLAHLFQRPMKTESLDATDALAIALCHHFQSGKTTASLKHYSGWDSFIKENKNRIK